ncbi:MAG: ribosome hibernation-promoting factor, HPF/YfiA family [bacterium]
MEITITGRHFEITPYLRNYVNKKLKKVAKYDHQILKGEIILFHDRTFGVAEGKIHSGHNVFTAKGYGNDMYEAVNDLTDKIVIQLERHLQKIRTRRRRAGKGKPGL